MSWVNVEVADREHRDSQGSSRRNTFALEDSLNPEHRWPGHEAAHLQGQVAAEQQSEEAGARMQHPLALFPVL